MKNSTNTLSREDIAATMRRTQMVPSARTHTEQMAAFAQLHQQQQQNSIYLSICSSNELNEKNRNSSGIVISEKFTPYTKDKKSFDIVVKNKDRVKVQHLQTHTKLQNNQWNYQTFCNFRERERDNKPNTINNNNTTNNNTIYQNESAFKLCINENQEKVNVAAPTAGAMQEQQQQQIPSDNLINESDRRSSPVCRTEDQENAFRLIEDVHNYSKLNRYNYSNGGGSSNSSVHEDDEEDEDEEDEDVDDGDAELEEDNDDDDDEVDESFETYQYFNRKKEFSTQHTSFTTKSKDIRMHNNNTINTITSNNQNIGGAVRTSATTTTPTSPVLVTLDETMQVMGGGAPPDHHARRPMNAFLIFCKRHRAIVKDKYKSFENRAITKILGDWWASLDANDKKCYTNLAQQNKDAFFSANPNFKWYKLPAPPLRTLNTRPGNTERSNDPEDQQLICAADSMQNYGHITNTNTNNHYFKLADEAQMGELSTLMCGEKKTTTTTNQPSKNHNALQQALGETTHYFSTQIPDLESPTTNGNKWKRKQHTDSNSFSSNSSEEDLLPKKSARSCKGKIYQELINSGQIAAITKKTKAPKVNNANFQMNSEQWNTNEAPMLYCNQTDSANATAQLRYDDTTSASGILTKPTAAIDCNNTTTTNYELMPFDLEKKIKELPALNLDAYLQRKRNTKKRKKINSKKRNSTSLSSNNKTTTTAATLATTTTTTCPPITIAPKKECNPIPAPPPLCINNPAVGSQKRKARKESITRRDISAIENEVAALRPLREDLTAITCNGRYYYNESPSPIPIPSAVAIAPPIAANHHQQPTVEIPDFLCNINNNISSTSDLLILAEVAAKRTEISN